MMFGRPCQNQLIASAGQPDIRCSHDIEIPTLAEQRAEDVNIETLVGEPLQPGYCRRRSSSRARIPSGDQRDSLDLRISSPLSLRSAR
jgi:hypothetical protein